MLRGGCFCRAVRYEIDAEPTNRPSGTARSEVDALSWLVHGRRLVRFVAGEPQRFKSSEHATRSFCPTAARP